ncbi:MAG TPA: phosphoenolpyruvate carboxylase, partial [Chondromyces sp.]|nr:phosphoenolpyruvate carboxylase [Chondromyces sp.]
MNQIDDRNPEAGSSDALRRDVSFLGAMLGEVLTEQGGRELFDIVEGSRVAARSRRGGDAAAERTLDELLRGLEPGQAAEVARAFSAYFALVNMAERVHRIRRRRDALKSGVPQPGSLEDVTIRLAAAGITADEVRATLAGMLLEPVFTSHPTEAIRRTILAKEQRVARILIDFLEHTDRTPQETSSLEARLRDEITLIWQTADHSGVKRTVADEVEHVLFYLIDVIYRVVPALEEAMASAMRAAWGDDDAGEVPWPFVRFGSWVGGDMDGNPNVGPETIQRTLERQRELIIDRYVAELRELFGHLSQSRSRVGIDAGVEDRCAEYRRRMPEVAEEIPGRYGDMPYRILLWFCWARLEAVRDGAGHAYSSGRELCDDLQLIIDSLRTNRGEHAGLVRTLHLARRAAAFGFHLATLDVRQDASVHRQVVGELLDDPDFADMDAAARTATLKTALESDPASSTPDGPEVERVLGVFARIGEARRSFGAEAIGPYIISMAQGPDDALAVLYLARRAGLGDDEGRVALDVAPLFETVDDLDTAGDTLGRLLADPLYRAHVASRGDRQIVMLGYSDSSKESGLAASRWALYRAESDLSEAARSAGVELTLFHGRGGTPSRGGSKPRAGILAQPPGVMKGRLRVTEQGEIIHAKYGLRGLALRTLELTAGAVLEATVLDPMRSEARPEWRDVMDTIAATARSAFRSLVYEDEDFDTYFRLATPIDVIERLEIGSRPASRRSGSGIESLRAIPWVFSWTQNRHLLPGWYGIGRGLEAALETHGQEVMCEMAHHWPFFTNLLADVEMALAKADMGIAERYAKLAGEAGSRLFPRISAEFQRTSELICQLFGTREVLQREPVLSRSIRLRNPYVDPISLLQVDLLVRWRARDCDDPALEEALKVTVRGIA